MKVCRYCARLVTTNAIKVGHRYFCNETCLEKQSSIDEFINKRIRDEQEKKTAKGENDTSPLGAD
jgi:hypothetical protein